MKLGIKFGINAIQAGQKSSLLNAVPQLIVKSTPGQFTITSPVSKALGIAAGENVMFANNLNEIEAALNNPADEIVAYAAENGWDLNTREGADAFIKDQLVYYIAKGILMYKRNGDPILGTVRITKEDKAAYIAEHGVEMVAALSEEEKAKLAAAKGLEDADDETLAGALTPDDVPSPTFHAATGSKTASSANATGIGLQLSFTDTAIWDSIKSDLEGDAKKSVNRVFNVNLDEPMTTQINNGKENVDVTFYPLEFEADKAPMVRGKKDDEVEE